MRTQSANSITTFLKCPLAYKLHYLDGVESKPSALVKERMDYGKWIEDQIAVPIEKCDEKAKPFKSAFNDLLVNREDAVVARNHRIEFELNGYKLQMLIDFITKKGKAIELKVTSSPSYYMSMMSYQVMIYDLGMPYQGEYVLLEKDDDGNFKQILTSLNLLTPLAKHEAAMEITEVLKMIEEREKSGYFPPSFNNCHECFYRHACDKNFRNY